MKLQYSPDNGLIGLDMKDVDELIETVLLLRALFHDEMVETLEYFANDAYESIMGPGSDGGDAE